MKRLLLCAVLIACAAAAAVAQTGPSVDQLIALKRAGAPALSPDGRQVAYTIREANWDENAYETEIWLADVATGATRQLTNAKKSSSNPTWSPDGSMIAFVSSRSDKQQIYVIRLAGGEAEAITSGEDGVGGSFAWAPDGKSIAYTITDTKNDDWKARDKKYGDIEVVDADHRLSHLWVISLATKTPARLTSGTFTVGSFDWSPDGKEIAFDFTINGDPSNGGTANISVVTVADAKIRPLVTQEGPDNRPVWSPDGSTIVFSTAMAEPFFYYRNTRLASIPAAGGPITVLTKAFDENPGLVDWQKDGILFSASQKTAAHLFRLNPATQAITRITPGTQWAFSGASPSADGASIAFIRSGPREFPEIWVVSAATGAAKKITDLGAQTAAWPQPSQEVISWKSKDGALIEGILHKPASFKAGTRHPLLIVVHGGPTGISRPVPFGSTSTYPIDIWLNKGALVLEPNYRGSAGYGEAFRSLNVRNLGIGDAWDVISGIDHLVAQGLVDNDKVGTMGWSQGGYISAFLTTHDSARFKAVSVGAGISNWMTYYVNTDIHPFTRQYLKATPWSDPKIYADTSPMTYINQAKAPTLIQHGELDKRVPIPNAYELYQGLQDVHVPARLIVYKGFGHGLTTPKAHRAAMEHNLEWFGQYIWGEKPLTLTHPVKETIAGVNNFYRVSDTIACGGSLAKPELVSEIKKRGYTTIINLRAADEPNASVEAEKAAAEAAGMRYVHIPTQRGTNTLTPPAIDQVISAISDPKNQPFYLHCGSGHRVSGFWLIKRVKVDGWAIDRALVEAEALGLSGPLKDQALAIVRGQ